MSTDAKAPGAQGMQAKRCDKHGKWILSSDPSAICWDCWREAEYPQVRAASGAIKAVLLALAPAGSAPNLPDVVTTNARAKVAS